MKKLMTMIAAVAMSFGLFADLPTGTGFDDLAAGALTTGGDSGWADWTAGDGNFATVTAWDGSGEVYTGARPTVPGQTSLSQAVNFLNLKTTFGNPLFRNADTAAVTLNEKLYFDSLVKFTACDEDPTTEYGAGTKLIVYVKEMTSNDGETVTGTNLFVKAGKWVSGELQSAIYDCGSFDSTTYGAADDWNRLTIKVFNNVYNNMNAGFEIFVNEIAVTHGGETGYVAANLTADAKILNSAGKLFPSMAAASYDSTIAGVGFDGQGLIDDVVFTKTAPEFADDKYFTLNWDKHVATVSYSVNGAAAVDADVTLGTAGFVAIPYSSGMTVAVTATYGSTVQGETWAAGTWDKDSADVALDGTTFTVSAPSKNGYIVSKETTPRISVTIGQTTTTYPTMAAAFAAVNAQSSAATLVLNQDLTLGTTTLGQYDDVSEGTITGSAPVTIDLNGKIITGPATCLGGYTIDATTTGGLTIIDNSDAKTGKILASNLGAVSCYGCNLTTTAGIFEGAVVVDAATSDIVAGKFARASNPNFKTALTKNADSEYDDSDQTYWIVKVATKYSLSVTGVANATFTIDGQKVESVDLKAGASYRVVATAAANYEYKADGEYPAGWSYSEGTLVNAGTMSAASLALTVPAPTAKVYTITYKNPQTEGSYENVPAEYTTYTVETKNKTLFTPPATQIVDGYAFTNWKDEEGNVFTGESFANCAGDLALTANFETLHSYTISYVFVDENDKELSGVTNPYSDKQSFTVEDTDIEFTTAATLENYEFDSWTPAAIACFKTFSDVVVTGKFTSAVGPEPTPVEPGEEITTDKTPTEINANTPEGLALKKTLLKAPDGATVGDDYYGLFDAVEGSTTGKVKFELNATGEAAVAASIAEQINPASGEPALNPAKIAAGTQTAMTVANPIVGFYYAINQAGALDSMKVTECELANGKDNVEFVLNKGTASGFYQILCSPTAIPVENKE